MGRSSDAKERLLKAVTELIWCGSYGSTTVDQICERAGVNKGSFYHFFDSKAALAEQAILSGWSEFRIQYDRVFSPSQTPLQRLHAYCEFCQSNQAELKKQYGHVLGCPLFTLGSEVSTQEAALKRAIEHVMMQIIRYFETTVRDAVAEGEIPVVEPAWAARDLFAYAEGLLTQARIHNDVAVLRDMESGMHRLLGVQRMERKAA